MKQIFFSKGLILLFTFLLALISLGYFIYQTQQISSPPPTQFLAADKGYGVTIDLTQYYDEASLTQTLTTLHEHGLTWLRQPIRWAEIESSRNQFDWQDLDRVVTTISRLNGTVSDPARKFKLIALLETTPTWARKPETSPMTPPLELSDWGNFARTFAHRYGHRIDYYQIWHEPNLSVNWGNAFVAPAAYADLMRDARFNIQAVDTHAYILMAALAPTLEEGPLNLNELDFLAQIYQAEGERWFDIVAVQLYGFSSDPDDPPQPDILNFRRLELLRQVMIQYEDRERAVWATAFGWNALPPDWDGKLSPWKANTPLNQARRTAIALQLARRDWPWLGPMLAIRWEYADLPPDDPTRGFALRDLPTVLEAFHTTTLEPITAIPGRYPATHPSGDYSPNWRFATTTADIPRHSPRTLTINFEGTRLDLLVNRGPYRAYLRVTVDGQPANALPQDESGKSYVVLYDPLRDSKTITLADHLPPGKHQAVIEAEGGWGQWAIGGWVVQHETIDPTLVQQGMIIATLLTLLSGIGLTGWSYQQRNTWLNLLLTWEEQLTARYAKLGERTHIALTLGLALTFYLTPDMISLFLLPLLALAILLRPDLGLALIALSLSFFLVPKQLLVDALSPVELLLILTLPTLILRLLSQIYRGRIQISRPKSTDWAILSLILLGLIAALFSEQVALALREWRVVILESALFYFLVRLGLDFSPDPPSPWRWVWRLIDAFILGATLQALIAIYLYFFTDFAIAAEGVRRALGLAYGSPNNLSLFLDRAWPILLVVPLLPGQKIRRWLYGLALLIVSLALYLTFSKGGLLISLPLSVLSMIVIYSWHQRQGRKVIPAMIGGLLLMLLALLPLSRTDRFRTTFDFSQGSTSFFRIKLWQASWDMLIDHWLLGVGPDNFLYQYRTRYIMPTAWQEPNLSHPHNFILDFGTRLGIGGIILFFWLQITFWRNLWRLYQRTSEPLLLGLMGSMVAFLGHGLVDNSYFLVDLAFIFCLTVGIGQGLSDKFLTKVR